MLAAIAKQGLFYKWCHRAISAIKKTTMEVVFLLFVMIAYINLPV
jgi:hypothetical protein